MQSHCARRTFDVERFFDAILQRARAGEAGLLARYASPLPFSTAEDRRLHASMSCIDAGCSLAPVVVEPFC